jgi:hypothetical protein
MQNFIGVQHSHTEYLETGNWYEGPDTIMGNNLHFVLTGHCASSINNTGVIIGGLNSTRILKYVWKYDFETEIWSRMPNMHSNRVNHACGKIKVMRDMKAHYYIVVAGGSSNSWVTNEIVGFFVFRALARIDNCMQTIAHARQLTVHNSARATANCQQNEHTKIGFGKNI